MLEKAIVRNGTIKNLGINFENRVNNENVEGSVVMSSYAPSQAVSASGSYLLSHNISIESYLISGYIESFTSGIIIGLAKNQTVRKLILDNIDMDRDSMQFFGLMFMQNSSLKELEIKQGFNTLSAMVIFQGLKLNKSIEELRLQECVFLEGGFIMMKNMLGKNSSLKRIEIKELLHLGMNSQNHESQVRNFVHIVQAMSANTSVLDLALTLHKSALNCGPNMKLFQSLELENALSSLLRCNSALKTLKIENFRLGRDEIKAISQGLIENQTLVTLVLNGNVMEWKDLEILAYSLRTNSTLMCLAISSNRIYAYNDLKNLYGEPHANEAINTMKEVFQSLNVSKLKTLRVTDWFFEPRKYPETLCNLILLTKHQLTVNSANI